MSEAVPFFILKEYIVEREKHEEGNDEYDDHPYCIKLFHDVAK